MFEGVTGMIVGAFDVAFAPLIAINPVLSLFLVSTIITLIILFFNLLLVNRSMVKKIKDEVEELREMMTQAQKAGNNDQAMKAMNEMMSLNSKHLSQTSKPLFISLIIVVLFTTWLGARYGGMELSVPFVSNAVKSFTMPVLGYQISAWMLWYVLVSFTIGWVLRKLLGFD